MDLKNSFNFSRSSSTFLGINHPPQHRRKKLDCWKIGVEIERCKSPINRIKCAPNASRAEGIVKFIAASSCGVKTIIQLRLEN